MYTEIENRATPVIQKSIEGLPPKDIGTLQAEFQAWVTDQKDEHDQVVAGLKRELVSRYLSQRHPSFANAEESRSHPEYVFRHFLTGKEVFCFPEHAPPSSPPDKSEYVYSDFPPPQQG